MFIMRFKESDKCFSIDYDVSDAYNIKLADPVCVKEWYGITNREIYLNYDINDYLININLLIIQWNNEDEEKNIPVKDRIPIKIFINSNGGDVNPALNLIDIISVSKTPVYTIGLGNCYSSGGLIFLAGHKRFVFENTMFLLHDGYLGEMNTTSKALDKFEFTKKLEEKIKNLVLSRTKISSDLYDKQYRNDWYIFSNEMIELGIADTIVSDINQIFE